MRALVSFFFLYFLFNFSESKDCLLRSDFDLKVKAIREQGRSSKTYLLVYSNTNLIEDLDKLKMMYTSYVKDVIFDYDCIDTASNLDFKKGSKRKELVVIIEKSGKSKYRSYKEINLKILFDIYSTLDTESNDLFIGKKSKLLVFRKVSRVN